MLQNHFNQKLNQRDKVKKELDKVGDPLGSRGGSAGLQSYKAAIDVSSADVVSIINKQKDKIASGRIQQQSPRQLIVQEQSLNLQKKSILMGYQAEEIQYHEQEQRQAQHQSTNVIFQPEQNQLTCMVDAQENTAQVIPGLEDKQYHPSVRQIVKRQNNNNNNNNIQNINSNETENLDEHIFGLDQVYSFSNHTMINISTSKLPGLPELPVTNNSSNPRSRTLQLSSVRATSATFALGSSNETLFYSATPNSFQNYSNNTQIAGNINLDRGFSEEISSNNNINNSSSNQNQNGIVLRQPHKNSITPFIYGINHMNTSANHNHTIKGYILDNFAPSPKSIVGADANNRNFQQAMLQTLNFNDEIHEQQQQQTQLQQQQQQQHQQLVSQPQFKCLNPYNNNSDNNSLHKALKIQENIGKKDNEEEKNSEKQIVESSINQSKNGQLNKSQKDMRNVKDNQQNKDSKDKIHQELYQTDIEGDIDPIVTDPIEGEYVLDKQKEYTDQKLKEPFQSQNDKQQQEQDQGECSSQSSSFSDSSLSDDEQDDNPDQAEELVIDTEDKRKKKQIQQQHFSSSDSKSQKYHDPTPSEQLSEVATGRGKNVTGHFLQSIRSQNQSSSRKRRSLTSSSRSRVQTGFFGGGQDLNQLQGPQQIKQQQQQQQQEQQQNQQQQLQQNHQQHHQQQCQSATTITGQTNEELPYLANGIIIPEGKSTFEKLSSLFGKETNSIEGSNGHTAAMTDTNIQRNKNQGRYVNNHKEVTQPKEQKNTIIKWDGNTNKTNHSKATKNIYNDKADKDSYCNNNFRNITTNKQSTNNKININNHNINITSNLNKNVSPLQHSKTTNPTSNHHTQDIIQRNNDTLAGSAVLALASHRTHQIFKSIVMLFSNDKDNQNDQISGKPHNLKDNTNENKHQQTKGVIQKDNKDNNTHSINTPTNTTATAVIPATQTNNTNTESNTINNNILRRDIPDFTEKLKHHTRKESRNFSTRKQSKTIKESHKLTSRNHIHNSGSASGSGIQDQLKDMPRLVYSISSQTNKQQLSDHLQYDNDDINNKLSTPHNYYNDIPKDKNTHTNKKAVYFNPFISHSDSNHLTSIQESNINFIGNNNIIQNNIIINNSDPILSLTQITSCSHLIPNERSINSPSNACQEQSYFIQQQQQLQTSPINMSNQGGFQSLHQFMDSDPKDNNQNGLKQQQQINKIQLGQQQQQQTQLLDGGDVSQISISRYFFASPKLGASSKKSDISQIKWINSINNNNNSPLGNQQQQQQTKQQFNNSNIINRDTLNPTISQSPSTCSIIIDQSQGGGNVKSCGICGSTTSELVQLSQKCKHTFCLPCVTLFLESKITSNEALRIRCPKPNCRAVIHSSAFKHLIPCGLLHRYKQHRKIILLRQNPNIRYCTREGCDGFMIGNPEHPKLICPKCGQEVCYNCCSNYHNGRRCDEAIEEDVVNELVENRQICPRCRYKQPITIADSSQNSNSNKCTCEKCSFTFCTLCLRECGQFHFAPWNLCGCPGRKYGGGDQGIISKCCVFLWGMMKLLIYFLGWALAVLIYPLAICVISLFMPLVIYAYFKGQRLQYSGWKKYLLLLGLFFLGIVFYPIWVLLSIIPGTCIFFKDLYQNKKQDIERSTFVQ